MEKVLVLLNKELDIARLQAEIRKGMEKRMSEQQHKFFLREQLKEIQKELGIAKDDRAAELDRFKERLETLAPSEEAQKRIDEEMDKMSVLEIGSPEYAVTRNYLDWLTVLPWGRLSEDKLDIEEARAVLDRDHEGLDDVKDRIIEFLSGRIEDVPNSRLDCLVDTGALMVLLAEDEVGKLGLSRGGRVIVTYADDRREELPTARGLEVSMLGRSMVTDCVIGPPLCEPLIGQLVQPLDESTHHAGHPVDLG